MSAADFVKLTDDQHQQALYRLAAVGQYLYDTMAGDADLAIKHGQRTRRRCLGGQLDLVERRGTL
jgi:hypothetical protein